MGSASPDVETAIKLSWNSYASTWSQLVDEGADVLGDRFFIPAFLSFIGEIKGRRILDLGCGEGRFTRALARAGAKAIGIDFASSMIDEALRKERLDPLSISYQLEDMTSLRAFPPDSFDAAASMMSLMDVLDIRIAAQAVFRVLKPRGDFWLIVLHPCFQTRYPNSEGGNWIIEEGQKSARIVRDYLRPGTLAVNWKLSQLSSGDQRGAYEGPRMFRTLSSYANGLLEAGFVMRRISEPAPPEHVAAAVPDLQPWRQHAALALLFHCTK